MKVAKITAKVTIECNTNAELVSRLMSLADRVKRGEFEGEVKLENKEITTSWSVETVIFDY